MLENGDDAAHCSNGLSAQNYRGATAEERAIYRKWIRGTVAFYGALVLIFGVLTILGYSESDEAHDSLRASNTFVSQSGR